jgi:FAD:protein FMN transferase
MPPHLLHLAAFAMATRFEFVLCAPGMAEHDLRAVGEEALREVEEWHRRLNRFEKSSELSFINRTAAHRPVRIDADLFSLLSLCMDVHRWSQGAFDITVAPAMNALRAGLPVQPAHRSTANQVSQPITLDPLSRTVAFADEGVSLDLGGIAKGFALDRAAAILRDGGITAALLHGGTSSIVAIGRPPGRSGWGVAVHGSGSPGTGADDDDRLVIDLRDQAMSVSAPRGRLFECGDQARGHIVDPRTGASAEAGTVLVIGQSAAAADAWSTALSVAGATAHAMPMDMSSALHDQVSGWTITGNIPLAPATARAGFMEAV